MVGGSQALLVVQGLSKTFGALEAVQDVSFKVREGEIFAIIGPNGAGKTTVFNCITGVYPATRGRITFLGQDILGLPQYRITELGIARTFQKIRIFKNVSVLENTLVGTHCRTKSGVWDALTRTPRSKDEERLSLQKAVEFLRSVGIEKYWRSLARQLPYGDQRRLEMARALATEPKLMLLDEPTAGMNPTEKDAMMSLIDAVRHSGKTVLLVEHDMKVVMGISDRIVVLNHGQKIAEGTPQDVRANQAVIEAYLGTGFRSDTTRD
jgi:branched-chain amino acid transport system ATP-binding protein